MPKISRWPDIVRTLALGSVSALILCLTACSPEPYTSKCTLESATYRSSLHDDGTLTLRLTVKGFHCD